MASSESLGYLYSMKAKEKVSFCFKLILSMGPYFSNYLRRSSSVNLINKIYYSDTQVRYVDFGISSGLHIGELL